VEQGTPTLLLAAGGAFAELWAQQTLPSLEKKRRESVVEASDVVVPLTRAAIWKNSSMRSPRP